MSLPHNVVAAVYFKDNDIYLEIATCPRCGKLMTQKAGIRRKECFECSWRRFTRWQQGRNPK